MRVLLFVAAATLALAGCKVPGQKASFNADDQAFCQTNYPHADACNADVKCEWFTRSDGKDVCRAKR